MTALNHCWMTRCCIILFFILPGSLTLWSQPPKQSVDEYERLIKYYRYYKQDSATYFASIAMAWVKAQQDRNGEARILLQQGMIDDNKGAFDSAQAKYRQALDIFQKLGSQNGIASSMIRLGVVELRNGKYDNAVKYFLDALAISEKVHDGFGIMEANYSISWAYLDRKNYSTAIHYLKIAERWNDSLPFSNISLNIFNHLGVAYRELGELNKARNYLEKGVQQSNLPEYQGLNITLINNLASVYSKQGLRSKAISLQEEALQRSRNIGNYLRELQTLSGLAKTYGKENPAMAIFYLRQAVQLAKEKAAYNQEIRFLKLITPIYIDQGDFKQAFLAKEREHNLADSFYYQSMSKNIESLKAEYELSKSNARVKELDLLNNKRRLELEKASLLRNVTFAGFGLLLIILVLLYNQYRIKQRNNREISSKNQSLEKLVDEKEWLLKEVHHRVKNNLHTIMSLLETQSVYLKDDALLAVQNSQHRVYAMSLIHQKLYQVDNGTTIDMAVYLPEMIDYLRDSFDTRQRIRFHTDIAAIKLDISQAIPVGLILNEAITNSIKYAFPSGHDGDIRISMNRSAERMFCLEVADNGIGLPTGWEKVQRNSLGLKLMKGLSEDINAHFTIDNQQGTTIKVEFPELFLANTPTKKIKSKATAVTS